MIDQPGQVWENSSSGAFRDQYTRLCPSFRQMQQLPDGVNRQLVKTANLLEETDQRKAGQINS